MEFANSQGRSTLDGDSGRTRSSLTSSVVEKRRVAAAAGTAPMIGVLVMFLVLVLADGAYSTEHVETQQLPATKRSAPLLSEHQSASPNNHQQRDVLMDDYLRHLIYDYDALNGGVPLTANEKPPVMSSSGTKRAETTLPFSGGIYGKRAAALPYSGGIYGKRAVVPFSGGIYGKRAAALPYSGGIYGKRVPAVPYSGGIYGKRSVGAMLDYESGETPLGRNAISVRAAMPPNGGFYGRRRRR